MKEYGCVPLKLQLQEVRADLAHRLYSLPSLYYAIKFFVGINCCGRKRGHILNLISSGEALQTYKLKITMKDGLNINSQPKGGHGRWSCLRPVASLTKVNHNLK